jgi:hypothetical protein
VRPVFVPLAAGLQTELAKQLVRPGATLLLENCSGQQTGKTQVRLGADVLSTSSQATLPPGGSLPFAWQLATLGESLVRFNRAPVPLHTWAPTPERWIRPTNDNGGIASYRKGPIKVDATPVFSGTQAGDQVKSPTVAVSGNVIAYVYETLSGASTGTTVVIMDRLMRRPIYTRRTGGGTRAPRVVIVGDRAVVAYESGGDLQVDSYNLLTYAIAQTETFAGAVTAGTAIDIRAGTLVAGCDVMILYRESVAGNLTCTAVSSTALSTNDTFNIRTTAAADVVPDLGFGWMQDLGGAEVFSVMIADTTDGLRVLWDIPAPAAGNSDAAATHVLDATATAAPSGATAGIRNIIGSTVTADASGEYRVLYEVTAPSLPHRARVKQVVYDAGATTDTPILSVGIRSKLWLQADSLYFQAAFDAADQRSYFTLSVPYAVTTGGDYSAPLAVSNVRDAGGLTEFTNAPSDVDFAAGLDFEVFFGVTSETRQESVSIGGTASGTVTRLFAVECVRLTHSAAVETEVGKPVEFLKSLFVPGGLLGQFDGSTYATAGFPYYPPAMDATADVGGVLPAESFRYRALYSFVDRNGRKWRSAPSEPLLVPPPAANTQFDLTIDTLRLYDRGLPTGAVGGFQIEVYRTQGNSDQGYFLVATVANDPTSDTVTFTDNVADDDLGEQLYTDGNGVENQLLPPIAWCVEHQGRLVCGESGTGTLWYSVEADFNGGLIFSEALTLDVGDPAEPTTGGAVFGQMLLVFKAGKVYAIDGVGKNALGQGDGYSARQIDQGVGCSNPQSIAVADDGVWFRSSSTRAGIHRTAGGAAQYVGGGVREHDDLTITSAVVVRDTTQIRFYTAEGTTLVWDWTAKLWGTYTGQPCGTATTGYSGTTGVVYANDDDATIMAEATSGSDGPYAEGEADYTAKLRSPWYQAAGISGWERVKRIQGVGDVLGAHTTVIRLYKDMDDVTPFQTATIDYPAGGVRWDWELRPAQQLFSSLMIEIEVTPYQPPDVTVAIEPSSEASIPPDAWAIFTADAGVTQVLGVVQAMVDQTGNARNVTSADGSRPGYVASGINGLPSIDFDIFDDMRLENATQDIPAGARHVVIVARPDNQIGGTLMSFRRTTKDWACYLYELGGDQYVWSDGVTNIERSGAPVDYSGAARLIEHVQDADNFFVCRVDGTTIAFSVDPVTTEDGSSGFVLGNRGPGGYTQGWIGLVGAWYIYDRVLTSTERAQLVAFCADKWGTPV